MDGLVSIMSLSYRRLWNRWIVCSNRQDHSHIYRTEDITLGFGKRVKYVSIVKCWDMCGLRKVEKAIKILFGYWPWRFALQRKWILLLFCCPGTAAAKPKVQSTSRRDIKTTKHLKEPTLCPMSILHFNWKSKDYTVYKETIWASLDIDVISHSLASSSHEKSSCSSDGGYSPLGADDLQSR